MSTKPAIDSPTLVRLWIVSGNTGKPIKAEIVGYERPHQPASYRITGYYYRLNDGRIAFTHHAFNSENEAWDFIAETDVV
jgi:hypothetical protein